jgi:hypothetical protein
MLGYSLLAAFSDVASELIFILNSAQLSPLLFHFARTQNQNTVRLEIGA